MTDAWSITDGYWDEGGTWHDTTPEVRAALAAAMGADERQAPPPPPSTWFVTAGITPALHGPADVTLEDGSRLPGVDELPWDLPLGYHSLQPLDGGRATRLIVTPHRCPEALRAWGWATQLYALRSRDSWGMGDLADLARLARWTRSLGGGVVMLNPLHANPPIPDQEPSPYFAASRIWRNPLYLRVEHVPGVAALGDELTEVANAGRALSADRRIDRDAVFRLKYGALELLFDRFEANANAADRTSFAAFMQSHGSGLARFAIYSVLAEHYGARYCDWPTELRHPDDAAVAAFAQREAPRVRFHAWLQWLVDQQLATAGTAGAQLIGDLAVGFEPEGADAWVYQDLLARGCRVGAPPDNFNAGGQDWGLPPFVPWKLQASGYEPLIATLRATLKHVGGLRIDHVMGLFRLYWIPPGADARSGAYVRYPAHELLDILALEATRAGAFVVGEDLGTVEDAVREEMQGRNLLSNRLLLFEPRPTTEFPEQALAAITTHDLPTLAGLWTGFDLAEQREILPTPNEEGDAWFRRRVSEATGRGPDAPLNAVIVAAHEALAKAPSRLVVGTLDDACAVPERPNLPGTIDERPNWRLALPLRLEQIEADPLALRVAAALSHHGKS